MNEVREQAQIADPSRRANRFVEIYGKFAAGLPNLRLRRK